MPLPSNMVQAVYRESGVRAYRGNPLIEALPPTLKLKRLKDALRGSVTFDPKDIFADGRQRAHIISSLLNDFFQPLGEHVQLEERISIMVRRGYVGRNLNDGSMSRQMQNGYERVMTGDLGAYRFQHAQSTALSLSLIGCSGSGKTSTLNRILATYPPAIFHERYNFTQVTYLKVDCPHDGSLKSLCIQFFRALDRVLQTDFETKYTRKRHGIETLLALMSQTANMFGIGVLVIDEIQHLSRKRSGGIEKMLNFFVTLVNTIGLPVVFVGTPKARPIFETDLRSGRRGAGFGALLWEPMKAAPTGNPGSDASRKWEWIAFSNRLWKYQWLQRREETLSDEIRDCWYDLSQGVLDIVVKLFVLAQLRAIVTRAERITPKLLRKVYDDELKPVHPMLAALRSGDPQRIAEYSDLTLPNVDRRFLELSAAIGNVKKEPPEPVFSGNEQAKRLHNMLMALECDAERVAPLVERVFQEHPGRTVRELMPIVLGWYAQEKHPPARNPQKTIPAKEWGTLEATDLRHILTQGDGPGMHARLSGNALIFDVESWLKQAG
ncbi:MAG TPA: AAA family ATPase [Desulfovibrio sp.]|uniref:AAA family ATPase n=1 Tax=Desulfovibrio sp. TaxID=885 RepID=UPI002C7A1335|nr:AAA family ATPase [Desulfovibrio sp.]HMM39616.1 AAA family ATPase [Desulfovibrio sp.]